MRFFAQHCFRTVRGTALSGVLLGFGLALAYGFVFAGYAIARSSFQIAHILSANEDLWGTLAANAFGILLPALLFALFLGVDAALLWGATLLLVYGLAALFNPHHSPTRAAWIGLIAAGSLASVLQYYVQRSLGSYFDALWPVGYFFWLGLPCLLFVSATTWLSWRLAKEGQTEQTISVRGAEQVPSHAVH